MASMPGRTDVDITEAAERLRAQREEKIRLLHQNISEACDSIRAHKASIAKLRRMRRLQQQELSELMALPEEMVIGDTLISRKEDGSLHMRHIRVLSLL